MLSLEILLQRALTALAGVLANVKLPLIKNYLIKDFIQRYNVNMHEALVEDPTKYTCFNDFFIRHLKPQCRPLSIADIISPVDGCVSEYGLIQQGQLLQAKGHKYTVQDLLSLAPEISDKFNNGSFMTLYLSPKDYHRVHMPLDGKALNIIHVPGVLFSVKPATVLKVPRLFVRNERLVVVFETNIGLMAMVMVGATIVGAIGTSWSGDLKRSHQRQEYFAEITLKKAEEMGYFKLGSTVIMLFANGSQIEWNKDLTLGGRVCFGQELGSINEC